MGDGPQVLIVNASWGWAREEGLDIQQLMNGMCATVPPGGRLMGTDGRSVFDVDLSDPSHVEPLGSWRLLIRMRIDVAHVYMVLPPLHLLLAILLRVRGVPVVCTPIGMLGRNFATASWFKPNSRSRQRLKPFQVAVWAWCWRVVASGFFCLGQDEARQAGLPMSRCALAPMPVPISELASAIPAAASPQARTIESGSVERPVALVSRFDPYRKGFDRIFHWVAEYASELPRPAVRVFAASPEGVTEIGLGEHHGWVHWDPDTRGAALAPALMACRAVILLSRWEGQPRVLREAALLGIPTISTACGNFCEVVTAIGAGVVVDGDRPEEINAAFVAVATHPRDPSRARAIFDPKRIAAYHWQVLEAVARSEEFPASYYELFTAQYAVASPESADLARGDVVGSSESVEGSS